MFLRDKNVISVEGRDGEDGNAVLRERLDEGEEDPSLRKGKWAFEFEADPKQCGKVIFRDIFCRADDGKFIGCAGDGGESALCRPSGNRGIGRLAKDYEEAGEFSIFKFLGHRWFQSF